MSRVYSHLLVALAVFPASALDHSSWDALLKKYVNGQSLVDYRQWRDEPEKIDNYLAQLAAPWPEAMTGDDRKAALINAYNAIAVRWILAHYPVESVWKTKKPFSAARHTLNGVKTSLDGIERELREMDPRIHSALVYAALGGPPLRREAYEGPRIDEQLDDNTRLWLADLRWNQFDSEDRTARVSAVFKWYDDDFKSGGLKAFLLKYAPPGQAGFLAGGKGKIDTVKYQWGLNDQAGIGEEYSTSFGYYWDYFRNR